MARTENGFTVESKTDHELEFVVADLAAKLAGVSLSTAVRVIAALDAIQEVHEIYPEEIAVFDDTPIALPDATRSEATQRAYEQVAAVKGETGWGISDDQWGKLRVD